MKILVTGVSGFIGTALVSHLRRCGNEPIGMVRNPGSARAGLPRDLELRPGDMSDVVALRAAVKGCDAVMHLAAATGVADPAIAQQINVDGTRILLEAAREEGAKRFIFVSTVSALRARLGPYGRTKREGEELTRASGLDWTIVRPGLVYGPGTQGLFATLSTYIRTAPVVPVLGPGTFLQEPIHVEDVCAVLAECVARTECAGQDYDLVGPEPMPFNGFLDLMMDELGMRKPRFHIPTPVAMTLASLLGRMSPRPPVSVDNVLGMTQDTPTDRASLVRDFPRAWVGVREGLRALVRGRPLPGAAPVSPGASPNPQARPAPLPPGILGVAEAPAPARPLRAAIVGLGKMGMAHSSVLSMVPNTTLCGAVDRAAALGKSLQGMGFQVPLFQDVERMLAEGKPDAVFLCTPQHVHRPLVEQCVAAGAAVFVEKPLAHTLEDARALADAVRKAGVPGACGFTLGYLPVFAGAKRLLDASIVGPVRSVESSMFLSQVFGPKQGWMYDPAISGGGVLPNIASHLVFLLDWYFGPALSLRAECRRFFGVVEDEVSATASLQGGAELKFETSWSVKGYPLSAVDIRVRGEHGEIRISNEGMWMRLEQPAAGIPAGTWTVASADLPQPAGYDLNGEAYYLEDAGFLSWVAGGAPVPGTVEAGLSVQRWMDAMIRSDAAGGKEVELQ